MLQLEHDLKLKEMKLEMEEMKNNSSIEEYKGKIMNLEIDISKLAHEKIELLTSKDTQIRKMKIEVKKLEQELIDSKMQTANLKMKLLEQQNTLSKLKKSSQEPAKQFESKFLEVLEKDGENKSRDKSPEKDFA